MRTDRGARGMLSGLRGEWISNFAASRDAPCRSQGSRGSRVHSFWQQKEIMMGNSLGDQFLKAGLVNKARLSEAQKSKNRQQRLKQKQKIDAVDEATVAARQAATDKVERDRELNRLQKEAAGRKAVMAQVCQLIELNRVPRGDGEVGFNFQDGTAIRKIFVTTEVHDRLVRGLLAIVRYADGYEVIPSAVAEKIMLRDESCIVSNIVTQRESRDDDFYADYKVPDDLMW